MNKVLPKNALEAAAHIRSIMSNGHLWAAPTSPEIAEAIQWAHRQLATAADMLSRGAHLQRRGGSLQKPKHRKPVTVPNRHGHKRKCKRCDGSGSFVGRDNVLRTCPCGGEQK